MRGEDDRVFTPSQLWMQADEDRVGWGECNGIYWRDPCYCSHIVVCLSPVFPCCPVLHLLSFLLPLPFCNFFSSSALLSYFYLVTSLSAPSVLFSLANHVLFPGPSFYRTSSPLYMSAPTSPCSLSLYVSISIILLRPLFHNSFLPSSSLFCFFLHTGIILWFAQDVLHQSQPVTEDQQSNNSSSSSGTYCSSSNTTFSCLTSLMYSLSQGGHSSWLIMAAQTLNLTEGES